ncbi:patatin family protein [Globicatella sp. HMSC072A10]|uniref:patatin-like phospholipase family protein n=1 Tax=Globicatella sp. HMSC072A10 TaxID=1739315 RepID=UPI0008B2E7C4|nr:patatin family protein [Globicatella sp. HMSC072A10]OFK55329.1 patatin family protein [Globicatella sp. HMSC072A10]
MKVGLLLEGGAMRGIYTAGVLDVMMRQNIKVNGIVAVSAGALFGVNYPSHQIGRTLRYNLKYLNHPQYMGLSNLLKTGNIVNKDFAYYEVPFRLDPFDQKAFYQSGIDFYATVTNLYSGKAEYIKITHPLNQMEVLRASSAMPLVSQIVDLNGMPYLDGGIADSIPIKKILSMGYDKVIVVLTQPKGYRKETTSSRLYEMIYRRYPNFVDTWKQRAMKYNQSLDLVNKLEEEGKAFVIQPSKKMHIGRLEKNAQALTAMYQLGVNDATTKCGSLKQYLFKN